jgi:hypothetical protein
MNATLEMNHRGTSKPIVEASFTGSSAPEIVNCPYCEATFTLVCNLSQDRILSDGSHEAVLMRASAKTKIAEGCFRHGSDLHEEGSFTWRGDKLKWLTNSELNAAEQS